VLAAILFRNAETKEKAPVARLTVMKTIVIATLLFLLTFSAAAQVPQPATERLDGLETVHGHVANGRGSRMQTILTRPAGTQGRLPAVMLVQWLSCDGIELNSGTARGMNELSRRIATQSGLVYLRVEKPGLGSSEGPPCSQADFQTELAGYRAGLEMLRAHSWVDPKRIVLIGMSNGGGVLPVVANDTPIAGFIAVNGWSKTWFEHMMEMLRYGPEIRGGKPGEIQAAMAGYAELYADYLVGKKKPGDVVREKPRLAKLWDDEPAHQYGRPAAFYHQLQELNLAEAWSKVASPTLAIWGEYDWIMSRDDHQRIVELVNRNKPGAARLYVVPKMTHFALSYDNAEQSIKEPRKGRFPEDLFTTVNDFLRQVVR
jgi:pimeloyl-ACP methyl ester carboxylesterase